MGIKNTKIFTMVMLSVLSIVVTGCATQYNDVGIYDSSFPSNQQATFIVPENFTVHMIDGDSVHWQPLTKVFVPVGIHNITYSYNKKSGGGGLLGLISMIEEAATKETNAQISYNFQAGISYTLERKKGVISIVHKK